MSCDNTEQNGCQLIGLREFKPNSDSVKRHEPVGARHVARVVGKIISFQRSHGNVVHVMSRSVQHELGMHTLGSAGIQKLNCQRQP
jgi:hypothetical protein